MLESSYFIIMFLRPVILYNQSCNQEDDEIFDQDNFNYNYNIFIVKLIIF